ncbi:hypothetical protein ACFOPN_00470 [Xanthomonas hyacinthi]
MRLLHLPGRWRCRSRVVRQRCMSQRRAWRSGHGFAALADGLSALL